jgi:hypothetical protein
MAEKDQCPSTNDQGMSQFTNVERVDRSIGAVRGGRFGGWRNARGREAGFTMVEIALSLAVVAFALVAIMGVLPTGMTVEKDNREDTLIGQEGRFWLEAIKNGSRGLDELTNYVENVRIDKVKGSTNTTEFDNLPTKPLQPGDIISLLSMPKYDENGFTNRVLARVRPITGAAADRAPMQGTTTNTIAFRYQMQVEMVKAFPFPGPLIAENPQMMQFNEGVGQNLWDVRLIIRWPVIERGNNSFIVGNGRKTFRARVQGQPWPNRAMGEGWPSGELSGFVTAAFTNLTVLRPNQFNVQAGIQ